jgi:Cytochrome P460
MTARTQKATAIGDNWSAMFLFLSSCNGRFLKTGIKAFRVMEKRTGWGSEYSESKRNGEWEYQAFLPDGEVDTKANPDSCFTCHKNGDGVNFMFTADRLKSSVR